MNNFIKILINVICLVLFSCNPSRKSILQTSGKTGDVIISSDSASQSIQQPVLYSHIQTKYAEILKVHPADITNAGLYAFIEKWLNTPYKWGGMNENGIDCSAFLQRLMADVYSIQIPRTSIQQFCSNRIELFESSRHLTEGDILFFRTLNNTYISHVGLYLHNGMFVNCSSSKGVSIGSLEDHYWKKKYVAAGRIKILGNLN
jgi:lipoprotein Spr